MLKQDEAYIGGKNNNRHFNKKVKNSQGRSTKDKSAVIGMVQRQGKANVRHVKDVKSCTLTKQITNYVEPHARLFTDEYVGYNQVSSMYNHAIVYHSQGEFANGEATTNTIESFWAIVKRGVMGIYHF